MKDKNSNNFGYNLVELGILKKTNAMTYVIARSRVGADKHTGSVTCKNNSASDYDVLFKNIAVIYFCNCFLCTLVTASPIVATQVIE